MHTTEVSSLGTKAEPDRFSPTAQAYGELHAAYDAFNVMLFNRALPPCLITLQRRSWRVYGYYSNDRFRSNRRTDLTTDEIAMNPMHFKRRDTTEVLQTLAHEMCHLWQYHFGKPSRHGYHNREWASKMLAIGLHPSSTGKPGGAIVGQHMADYLILGGALATAIEVLADNGFGISWYDRIADLLEEVVPAIADAAPNPIFPPRSGMRIKYSCKACKLNAWAKPKASLLCGDCRLAMLPQAGSRSFAQHA